MNQVEEVKRQTSRAGADQVVTKVTYGDGTVRHYLVSSVNALVTGPETMVFSCDEDGDVSSWGDLWSSRPYDE